MSHPALSAGNVAVITGRRERGDFYILCPNNDASRVQDERHMAWATGDIIESRPALSRWHPDFADTFAACMAG